MAREHPARTALFSLEQIGIKLGLDQIRALVSALGHPDRSFRSIVIAGTNGKGSVTAMIERGLRAAGLKTGRYTSPHLVHIEERFAINGTSIAPDAFDRLAARVLAASAALPAPPSFFEATTALALEAFRDAAVDVALLEVGLGGRLDATNVVDPIAAVITMIDFDHQQYLGNTLVAIAREKAGVIKPGAIAILGTNPPEVESIVRDRAVNVGARLINVREDTTTDVSFANGHATVAFATPERAYPGIRLALAGRHQVQNAATAVRALEACATAIGLPLGEREVALALADAAWPARLETRRVRETTLLIDGAHNPAGARALAAHVLDTYGRALPFVVGIMRDKDAGEMLRALAPAATVMFCTAARSPRAATPAELFAIVRDVAPGLEGYAEPDPLAAVRLAAMHGQPVVVAGSLYLAGQVRDEWS